MVIEILKGYRRIKNIFFALEKQRKVKNYVIILYHF